MSIKSAHIKKFTAFENLQLEFSPGVNVFIGANSTGKTHLMKLLYSVTKTLESNHRSPGDHQALEVYLKDKLARVFRPMDLSANRLVRRVRSRAMATVSIGIDKQEFTFKLTTQSNLSITSKPKKLDSTSIFVPSREALSLYEGFIDAYDKREISLDETYYDLCKLMSGAQLRGPRGKRAKELIEPLAEAIGGRVELSEGGFRIINEEGVLEAHLVAEGFRKLGSIFQLIANGSLLEGSLLFWDEPEANLNPKLVRLVSDMLRALANEGVQIFVATHDYLLTGELSNAVEYGTEPKVPIKFFALSRKSKESGVSAEIGNTISDLDNNPILEEFAAHYDREQVLYAESLKEGKGKR